MKVAAVAAEDLAAVAEDSAADLEAVEALTGLRAKCTRQYAQTAEKTQKCRSSQQKADRFIAVTATRITGSREQSSRLMLYNLIEKLVRLFFLFFVAINFYFFFS